MSNLIERMSFIVPVVSISFIFIIISINLYMKIRKLFPIRVNCWFCNKDANVPYSQFNSWNCEHCTQYNGFDKDGDYNCDIPAQRSIQLNKRYKTGNIGKISFVASDTQRNRLCENCNRNQEIKVQQLALFEPIVKANFHMEIEKFREKLEKSYELCHTCQRSVKKTLNRIMNNVLGLRLAQIGQKGLNVLDRHVKKTDSKKHVILNRMCLMAISILSIWNICNSSKSVHLSRNHVDSFFPPLVTHYVLSIISFISAIKLLVIEYSSAIVFPTIDFQRMYSYIAADNNDYQIDFVINIAAVLLSLKLVLARSRIRKTGRKCSLLLMFLWNVNMLWPTIARSVGSEFVADLLKIFFGVIILVVVIIMNYTLFEEATYKCQPLNNSFHRIFSNCDEDLSDDEAVSNNVDYCRSTPSKTDYDLLNLNRSFNTTKSLSPDVSQDLNSPARSDDRHSFWYQQQYNRHISENMTTDGSYSPFLIPDDCQSKLTDLKISGIGRNHEHAITCSSPTPSILINDRDRSQLLTPARLNFKDCSPLSGSATKTSWVAGGYFVKNNLSPQKRKQPQSVLFHPISRTSSQSSGFESRTSSAHNGYTSGSRESSITGDVASNFSEPTLISDYPPNINFPINHSFSLYTKNQTSFMNNSSSCEPESVGKYYTVPSTNYDDRKRLMPVPKSIYHQFGTHRLDLNDKDSGLSKFSHHAQNICKANIDSFIFGDSKKFSNWTG